MTIKDGFNSAPLIISATSGGSSDPRIIELKTEFSGLTETLGYKRNDFYSWVTIAEAIELRDELNKAIKEATGL